MAGDKAYVDEQLLVDNRHQSTIGTADEPFARPIDTDSDNRSNLAKAFIYLKANKRQVRCDSNRNEK